LVYSTYLGGSGKQSMGDYGFGIAVDSSGNAYVTGITTSTDFPVTSGAFQTTNVGGLYESFVTKFNPSGSGLVYSTYLGRSGADLGYAIAVDGIGDAYVTGQSGPNFPTTPGAFQTTCCGAFLTKFDPSGSALVYSTYLTGSNISYGIAVDALGDAYITGSTNSKELPTTPGAFQRTCEGCGEKENGAAFVTKFNPSGSALVYSTYLGGPGSSGVEPATQQGSGIAVDSTGNAYITGHTPSNKFPVTKGAFQTTSNGQGDFASAFVTKLDLRAETTTTLTSSTNPSTYEQPVTFTAVVTSVVGAPSNGETVSFMKGKTVLGTGTLTGGSASFTTSSLPVGSTSVTAVYGGDSNFAGSTSKAVKQVVDKATD
jgi:Bacterial Ig-like domain (group 3)/Beta-propeller repeat